MRTRRELRLLKKGNVEDLRTKYIGFKDEKINCLTSIRKYRKGLEGEINEQKCIVESLLYNIDSIKNGELKDVWNQLSNFEIKDNKDLNKAYDIVMGYDNDKVKIKKLIAYKVNDLDSYWELGNLIISHGRVNNYILRNEEKIEHCGKILKDLKEEISDVDSQISHLESLERIKN